MTALGYVWVLLGRVPDADGVTVDVYADPEAARDAVIARLKGRGGSVQMLRQEVRG